MAALANYFLVSRKFIYMQLFNMCWSYSEQLIVLRPIGGSVILYYLCIIFVWRIQSSNNALIKTFIHM